MKSNRPSSTCLSSFDRSDLQRASCFLDLSISSWAFLNKLFASSLGNKEKNLMLTCNLRVFIIGLENHPVKCYKGINYSGAYIIAQR